MSQNCSCPTGSVFSIFTGDAKTLFLKALNGAPGGNPLDLTSATEIIVSLPNADGTFLNLKKSLGDVVVATPANLGNFSAPISSIQSALLQPGELQTFNVTFTIGASVFTVPYQNALSVFEQE